MGSSFSAIGLGSPDVTAKSYHLSGINCVPFKHFTWINNNSMSASSHPRFTNGETEAQKAKEQAQECEEQSWG